jgi:hypothetical protein
MVVNVEAFPYSQELIKFSKLLNCVFYFHYILETGSKKLSYLSWNK